MRKTIIGAALFGAAVLTCRADAFHKWNWQYTSYGFHAAGVFVTNDAPDADGFYQIVSLTGMRNGVRIAALAPKGHPIPGNAPYAVDNRVRTTAPQLTKAGFGFRLADRDWANAFVLNGTYLQYLSVPPYKNGAGPEGPISFSATMLRGEN